MVNISSLLSLAENLKNNTELNHVIWVTTESELSKKLPKASLTSFPALVVVTPSYDSKGSDRESIRDITSLIFFILSKQSHQNIKEEELVMDMDKTLSICKQIETILISGFPNQDTCYISNHVDPESFHIDPEFNYLGCNGWSMTFELTL